MDGLSVSLTSSNIEGRTGHIFLNHLWYADDLCLIRLSSAAMPILQVMTNMYLYVFLNQVLLQVLLQLLGKQFLYNLWAWCHTILTV